MTDRRPVRQHHRRWGSQRAVVIPRQGRVPAAATRRLRSGGGPSSTGPDRYSLSYVQARPIHAWAHTDDCLSRLLRAGWAEQSLDDFFDIQVEERGHIRRVALERVRLRTEGIPGGECQAEASVHLTIWSIGFAVWRVTVSSDDVSSPQRADLSWIPGMHALEHELPDGPVAEWDFSLGGREHRVRGNVRRLFDYLGFAVHELLLGRPVVPSELLRWSSTFATGQDRARELVQSGETAYSYPVTFGSHFEWVWDDERDLGAHPSRWVPGLMGFAENSEPEAYVVDAAQDRSWWFMREFQSLSVAVAPRGGRRPRTGMWEPYRVQLIEYLALRRGVLRSIQRETLRVAAERAPLARQRVSDWLWLMSVVTDEYVLGGWQAARFERMKACFRQASSLRDISTLETQVRLNIETFQGRLDAESDRVGVAAAVLFGIVAATALVPGGQVVMRGLLDLDGDFDEFPFAHPLPYVTLTVGLLSFMALVGWLLLRRVRWLRPPRSLQRPSRVGRARRVIVRAFRALPRRFRRVVDE